MNTQQYESERQQKAQAPSPAKEHRWIVALFSFIGVLLPLVGGWWVEWPLVDIIPSDNPDGNWLAIGVFLIVVPVTIGAFLLCFAFRAWRAAVFAGIAWFIGEILAGVVHPLVLGGWAALPDYQQGFWAGEVTIIWVVLVPILVGMGLGAACAYPLVKWRVRK